MAKQHSASSHNGPDRVEIRVLPSSVGRSVAGVFLDLSGDWLSINGEEQFESGTPVTVQHEDVLFMGEIAASLRGPDSWHYKIRVEHTLTDLQGLLKLREALLGKQGCRIPADVVG